MTHRLPGTLQKFQARDICRSHFNQRPELVLQGHSFQVHYVLQMAAQVEIARKIKRSRRPQQRSFSFYALIWADSFIKLRFVAGKTNGRPIMHKPRILSLW
jgi:hypothetical protein